MIKENEKRIRHDRESDAYAVFESRAEDEREFVEEESRKRWKGEIEL